MAPFPSKRVAPFLPPSLGGDDGNQDREEFAPGLARAAGVRHAHLLSSCRGALLLLLRAFDLPPGSELLLTPITHWDMVNAVLQAGLDPVFVDLGHRTGSVDPRSVEEAITARTRALLITHLHGVPGDMERLLDIARTHGIEVIEDVSYGIGAELLGRPLGSWGRAAVISTSLLKPVTTLGGGAILTNDQPLRLRIGEALARAGARGAPATGVDGWLAGLAVGAAFSGPLYTQVTSRLLGVIEGVAPGRFDEIQRGNPFGPIDSLDFIQRRTSMPGEYLQELAPWKAGVGAEQLAGLEGRILGRRRRARFVLAELESICPELLPRVPEDAQPAWWHLPLWTSDRSKLRRHLRAGGIDTSIGGLPCCSRAPAFAHLSRPTPEARRYSNECLYLPNHPELTRAQLLRMVELVGDWWRSR